MTRVEDLQQKFLLIGLFLMSCVDAVFTLLWIKIGVGEELNPVLLYFLQWGNLSFVTGKVLLTVLGSLTLFLCRENKSARNAATILFSFYFLLILYHCFGSLFLLLESSSF